jgi:hypothetical protein
MVQAPSSSRQHAGRARREWRRKKAAERKAKAEEVRKDRLRKGILTGWEIFMENATNIVDDENAGEDNDMMREIDEEEEIRRMEALSLAAQRDARRAVRGPLLFRGCTALRFAVRARERRARLRWQLEQRVRWLWARWRCVCPAC